MRDNLPGGAAVHVAQGFSPASGVAAPSVHVLTGFAGGEPGGAKALLIADGLAVDACGRRSAFGACGSVLDHLYVIDPAAAVASGSNRPRRDTIVGH